jgi:CRISPR-associated protein (TIGR03986 family)
MIPSHSNPSIPNRIAYAPYNFVSLPQQVVSADYKIPGHDKYAEHNHTGYLDCILTTLTPTYTRTALSPDFFARWNDDKLGMMRDNQAREVYAQFFGLDDVQRPMVPGSSLRGMARSLIEIAGYGKMDWVSNDTKITFRAIGAKRDDPLKASYDQVLGNLGSEVRAGYLLRKGEDWFVQPALLPGDCEGLGKGAFIKVKESQISPGAIPGFIGFNDQNYRPQYHEVSFDARVGYRKGRNYVDIINIGPTASDYSHKGILVCSGNMLETANPGQLSPRSHHVIILPRNTKAEQIKIRKQSIEDYLNGLTLFQKKQPPFDSQMGCLLDRRPIFYVEDKGEVIAFGHSPNFRIPYWLRSGQAATTLDLVPKQLRTQLIKQSNIDRVIDIAEAIFGYVAAGKRVKGRAGRVFFTDATCEPNQENIWLPEGTITPKILGGPKPTTFQHYLVQNKEKKHDPDKKYQLAHYGTPTPDETVIRGHKLYWHKQDGLRVEDFGENEVTHWESDTQHTQIKPVSEGIRFGFRVYFENLTDVELGALLWVLDLPDGYHHKIGMGKPLGLGSVAISPELIITNRSQRYSKLFNNNHWNTGEDADLSFEKYKKKFEDYVLKYMDQTERDGAQALSQIPRIQMLLKMLKWPGPNPSLTKYMAIELNQYKDRPVLPDPLNVEHNMGSITSKPKTNVDKIGKPGKNIDLPSTNKSVGMTWLENTAGDLKINLDDLLKKRPKDLPKRWMAIRESGLKIDVLNEIVGQLKASGIWDNPPTPKLEDMVEFFKSQIKGEGP